MSSDQSTETASDRLATHYGASEQIAETANCRSVTTSGGAERVRALLASAPPVNWQSLFEAWGLTPGTAYPRLIAAVAALATPPVGEREELIERLMTMYSHRGDGIPTQFVNPDGPEAARLIASQAEEIEQLQAGVNDYAGRYATAVGQRAEVEAMAADLAAEIERLKADCEKTTECWDVAEARAQAAEADAARSREATEGLLNANQCLTADSASFDDMMKIAAAEARVRASLHPSGQQGEGR